MPLGQLHGRNIGSPDTSQCVEGVDTSLLCLVQCRLAIIGILHGLDSKIYVFIVLRHQQGFAGHSLFGVVVRRYPSVSTPKSYNFHFADLLDHNIGLGINNGSTSSLVISSCCYKFCSRIAFGGNRWLILKDPRVRSRQSSQALADRSQSWSQMTLSLIHI